MEPRGELVHPVVGGRSLKGRDLVHDYSDRCTNTLLQLKGFKNCYLVQQKLRMLDLHVHVHCMLYKVDVHARVHARVHVLQIHVQSSLF